MIKIIIKNRVCKSWANEKSFDNKTFKNINVHFANLNKCLYINEIKSNDVVYILELKKCT